MKPMRQIGKMIKHFFTAKNKQYWFRYPAKMKTLKDKEDFIMVTIEFLSNSIEIENKSK